MRDYLKGSIAFAVAAVMGLTAADRAPVYRAPRTADGKPNLNGIWQSLNTANWDIQGHAARASQIVALGAAGAVPAGLGVVEGNELPYLAAAIGALGAFVALSFFSIDLRNRELIHAGERPLKELQGRLADKLALDSLRILEAVEFPRYRWTRMGRIVRTMHLVVMAAFIAACIYAIVAGK